MEVKIKNNNELIDATIEMVDGVMVVSPKEEKVDISQFKDGDVITCGHEDYHWTCILRGEIECIVGNLYIEDYCGINCDGTYYTKISDSDSATWVRYATEKEKKALFDRLAKEGLTWDSEKKELVKLKWKPKDHEKVFVAGFTFYNKHPFAVFEDKAYSDSMQWRAILERGWHFKTESECQAFVDKLNQAISQVKP